MSDLASGHRAPQDRGNTLLELLITVVLTGLVTTVLAGAIVVTLRTTPATESRLDDARSTRGLATWLSHDTTSAPGFLPETAQGGINLTTTDDGSNNACGGAGSNLLHLKWREKSVTTRTFVANYRLAPTGADSAMIVRYTCQESGSGVFTSTGLINLTSRLKLSQPPVVTPTTDAATGKVTSISFALTGVGGDQVVVNTGSRNPADFFPVP